MKNTTVPESTIRSIFCESADVLADSKAITAAPTEGKARMVKGKSTPSHPHPVQFEGLAQCGLQ